MDKNTITGMALIFLVLIVFSYLSRPSQEQLAAQQQYYDSIAQVQQRAAELQAKAEAALANERMTAAKDSTSLFFSATQGTEQLVSIENNLAKLTLNTSGGSLYSVMLKEYMSQDKVTPVTLFEDSDVSLNYLLYNTQGVIETSDYFAIGIRITTSNNPFAFFVLVRIVGIFQTFVFITFCAVDKHRCCTLFSNQFVNCFVKSSPFTNFVFFNSV